MRYFLLVVFAVGCHAEASRDALVRRASFDLRCAAGNLRYVKIDDYTVGVMGCNRRGTYVDSCDGPRANANTSCTWVLNGAVSALMFHA